LAIAKETPRKGENAFKKREGKASKSTTDAAKGYPGKEKRKPEKARK